MPVDDRHDAGVRLAELIGALSLATDLGMGQPMEYALRACVVAVRLGEALGLGEEELREIYYVALLRFVGCNTDAHVAAAIFGDELAAREWLGRVDWGRPSKMLTALVRHLGEGNPPLRRARMVATGLARMPRLMGTAAAHCEVAQRLAGRLGLGAGLDHSLDQLFERWDGRGLPRGLKGEDVALPVRVVQLAQDAEMFHRLGGVAAATAMARERSGGAYEPGIVARFRERATAILAREEHRPAWEAALDAEPGPRLRLSGAHLDEACRAMGDFADLKLPEFAGHSAGVGELAGAAAVHCGLSEPEARDLRRAGYLHDLGRSGVPAGILGRRGPIAEGEWERVRLHPYYTERVLARPHALTRLGELAAHHHERLDGSGYHRGAGAAALAPAARILAAADVYQALAEPRPHRPALPPGQAAEVLQCEARAGRLCGEAVAGVLAAAGHRVRTVRRERPAGLSEREIQVVRLIARGLSNREMAQALVISRKTVGHHIQHIYDKIGVSTRAGATLFAMQHDLLRGASDPPHGA